jgi:hypothetical protein
MTAPHPIDFAKPLANGIAAPGPKLALLDAPAIAAPVPDLAYLVRELGLVEDAGPPHLVAGYGYSGKTLAMQSLALSLAAALPVWGYYSCPDVRHVIHVDYEQGERLTRIRYQRLARAMRLNLASLGDRLALAVMPKIKLGREFMTQWYELMTERNLLIVDSLRAATFGEDENSSQIRGALDMLGEISEQTGCRALVIHHARKPSQDSPAGGRFAIRGSSAIYDASDCAYVFSAEKGAPIRVAHERAKSHGETVEDFTLAISDVAIDGDPKAGLALRVHGTELLSQQRDAAAKERAEVDGRTIIGVLRGRPGGVKTMDLRAISGLSGQRFALAMDALGGAVSSRDERRGKARAATFYYCPGHLPDTGGAKADGPASGDDGQPYGQSGSLSPDRPRDAGRNAGDES